MVICLGGYPLSSCPRIYHRGYAYVGNRRFDLWFLSRLCLEDTQKSFYCQWIPSSLASKFFPAKTNQHKRDYSITLP
jgi:hypothetical protein